MTSARISAASFSAASLAASTLARRDSSAALIAADLTREAACALCAASSAASLRSGPRSSSNVDVSAASLAGGSIGETPSLSLAHASKPSLLRLNSSIEGGSLHVGLSGTVLPSRPPAHSSNA